MSEDRFRILAKQPRRQLQGFTLLEVIVALTITGFILGGLFSLVGGSKQLTWRAEANLDRATRARAAINFALLQDEFSEVEPILEDLDYELRPLELVNPPERQTQPMTHALQRIEIIDAEREEVFAGTRWVRLELPQ